MTAPLVHLDSNLDTICLYCAYETQIGHLYCEACGKSLQVDPDTQPTISPADHQRLVESTLGRAQLAPGKPLILHISDTDATIAVQPAQQITLGRRALRKRKGSTGLHQSDIDLTAHGAFTKGVSRMHAAITREQDTLTIMDLLSANGTYLNGELLEPHDEQLLHEGDEVFLGSFRFHIYFD